MTTEADILGRPPVMKPLQRPEERAEPDWRGEHLISRRPVQRLGAKFTLANAVRAARRKGKS